MAKMKISEEIKKNKKPLKWQVHNYSNYTLYWATVVKTYKPATHIEFKIQEVGETFTVIKSNGYKDNIVGIESTLSDAKQCVNNLL